MPKAKILPTTQRNVQPCDQEPEFSPIQQAHRPMILGSQPAMHNVPTWLVCPQQLKTAGAFWGHTKTGKVNNTEKYIWGSLKILYYDNATGSKTFTKCGWISPKEEFGESHSSLLSCQMTIFFHCMKQMKEFQEKKLNMRRPERTDTIKSKHECKGMKKCWNYHYHLVKKETKSDEEKRGRALLWYSYIKSKRNFCYHSLAKHL